MKLLWMGALLVTGLSFYNPEFIIVSGVLFNFVTTSFPAPFVHLLELNPYYYIVNGFRESFIGTGWFWQHPMLTLEFWMFVFFVLLIGSHLHYKFRSRFVDLI